MVRKHGCFFIFSICDPITCPVYLDFNLIFDVVLSVPRSHTQFFFLKVDVNRGQLQGRIGHIAPCKRQHVADLERNLDVDRVSGWILFKRSAVSALPCIILLYWRQSAVNTLRVELLCATRIKIGSRLLCSSFRCDDHQYADCEARFRGPD